MAFTIRSAGQVALIATSAGLGTAALVALLNPQVPKGPAAAVAVFSFALLVIGATQF